MCKYKLIASLGQMFKKQGHSFSANFLKLIVLNPKFVNVVQLFFSIGVFLFTDCSKMNKFKSLDDRVQILLSGGKFRSLPVLDYI